MAAYMCPMHPSVTSEQPGTCTICTMRLVKASALPQTSDNGLGQKTWRNYLPLIVIVAMIFASSLAVSFGSDEPLREIVLAFMTGFFLVFGGFKLLDLKGFASGYSTYDLLAKRWYGYSYLYPFIEVGFGFTMLAGYHPDWLLMAELLIMTFGGIGVLIKLARREKFMCVCLGTLLKVPLTYVTLVENFGMALLALLLLFVL